MPPISQEDHPFLPPSESQIPKPLMGGCWVVQPEGTLSPDPNEPPPPGLPAEPQPE